MSFIRRLDPKPKGSDTNTGVRREEGESYAVVTLRLDRRVPWSLLVSWTFPRLGPYLPTLVEFPFPVTVCVCVHVCVSRPLSATVAVSLTDGSRPSPLFGTPETDEGVGGVPLGSSFPSPWISFILGAGYVPVSSEGLFSDPRGVVDPIRKRFYQRRSPLPLWLLSKFAFRVVLL